MSNAPFKIAFWMMSLAFVLTILMIGLKPEQIRLALNPSLRPAIQNEPETIDHIDYFPDSETTIATATSDLIITAKPSRQDFHKIPQTQQEGTVVPTISKRYISEEIPQNSATAQPIRVASADPDAPIGYTDGYTESQQLQKQNTEILIPIPDARFALADQASIPRLKKPVPDPIDVLESSYNSNYHHELSELRGSTLRLKLAQARREFDGIRREHVENDFKLVRSELDKLKEQIEHFKKQQQSISKDGSPTETTKPDVDIQKYERGMSPVAAEVSEPEAVEIPEMSDDEIEVVKFESITEISPAKTEETFNFRFEHVEIGEVLKVLGKHGGRTIVLEPEISGTYSGDFQEMTANQAFAAVIKANQFGLSFRGDYILVRAERDPKIR